MATNLYVGRRAAVAAPADDADDAHVRAMQDALDSLKANDPKKAAAILAAAIEGTYEPEDNGEVPPVEDMESEGIPKALASEIGEQAQTNPALARSSLRHARARLGTTTEAPGQLSLMGVRARVENPWLPFGGKGAA